MKTGDTVSMVIGETEYTFPLTVCDLIKPPIQALLLSKSDGVVLYDDGSIEKIPLTEETNENG